VADAGAGRVWQMPGRVTLDGTGSYDPDPVDQDRLVYLWTQVEGPAVSLENGETAKAHFVGEPGAIYVFELVVSDGFGNSEPSQVRMVAVGGAFDMQALEIPSLDSLYPHYLDISGTRAVFAADTGQGYSWRIGLGEMATGEITTFSSSGLNMQPKIEGNLVVWAGGARFSNNIVTRECTSVLARDLRGDDIFTLRERSDTQSFSHPAISGRTVVWVQHLNIDKNVAGQWNNASYDICGAKISDLANPVYFTIATGVGQRDPLPLNDLLNDYDDVVEIDGDIVVWEGDGDIYAADISNLDDIRVFTVCDDEGRQSDPAVSGSYVVWMDERDDEGDIYGADISDLDNIRVFDVIKDQRAQRQPTIDGGLVACVQGETTGGRIRMACITRHYGVMQLDVPDGSYALGPVFDGSYLGWLRGTYGPIAGSRVAFGYSIHDGVIENVTTGQRYDYIQHAISDAEAGSEIVVPVGVHDEELNFVGKAITVRSTAPDDPAVVAATIFTGDGQIVTCGEGESDATVLDGLTISGGSRGVFLSDGSPTIKRCTIASNRGSGMFLVNGSRPELIECHIVANEGDGIAMWYSPDRRTVRHSQPTLRNCVVAGNDGAGVQGGKVVVENSTIAENRGEGIQCIAPTVANSIVYFNDAGGAGVQVGDDRADVTYSDIEGGWSGEGNIDIDPAFAQLGRGLDGRWLAGDYHLQSLGGRWDASAGQWVFDTVTSPCIDAGDPAAPLLEEPLSVPGASIVNERVNMGAYGGTREASVAMAGN
jgi:beta propeller repeat protein